jgi:hypothetical protein
MRTTASKLIAISQSKSVSLTLLEGAAERNARVVDEDVDAALRGAHGGRERRGRGAIGDVDDMAAGANAERFGRAGGRRPDRRRRCPRARG